MQVILTWRYLVAFSALIMLCGTSRELVHHFTDAIVRHGFGTKTFNSFTLDAGCDADLTAQARSLFSPLPASLHRKDLPYVRN